MQSSKRNRWKTIKFKCIYLFTSSPCSNKNSRLKYAAVEVGTGAHNRKDAIFSLGSQGILEVVVMACLVTQQVAHVAGAWGQTVLHPTSRACTVSWSCPLGNF